MTVLWVASALDVDGRDIDITAMRLQDGSDRVADQFLDNCIHGSAHSNRVRG